MLIVVSGTTFRETVADPSDAAVGLGGSLPDSRATITSRTLEPGSSLAIAGLSHHSIVPAPAPSEIDRLSTVVTTAEAKLVALITTVPWNGTGLSFFT